MARCLIIGCGCRGRLLARDLLSRGDSVRGTTRDSSKREQIEATGAEAVVADPDRVATLAPALEHVAVACLLWGSARGDAAQLAALHGSRLEMLLSRMLDTTIRGVVYEATGNVDASVLAEGAARVGELCGQSRIPYVLLRADPRAHQRWQTAALDAVDEVLTGRAQLQHDR